MYTTYILKSIKDNKYYIGCTRDIRARLHRHNMGWVRSTKYRIPLELVYGEEYSTFNEARKRELYLKSLKSGNEFKNIIKSVRR